MSNSSTLIPTDPTVVDLAFVAHTMGMDYLTQADLDSWIRSEGEKVIRHMAEAERLAPYATDSAEYFAELIWALLAEDGYNRDALPIIDALHRIAEDEAGD
jgi:hypothetical protein